MRAVLYDVIFIIIINLCNLNLRGIFMYALNTPVGYIMHTMTHLLGNHIFIYIIYYLFFNFIFI